jgi:hypothetical protein
MWKRDLAGPVLAALLMAACGGAAVPNQKLANAKASIRGAEEVGAEQNPQAALHLKMARDQVAKAERLIDDDDNESAALTLNQAQADADLALAMAREEKERQLANQAKTRIEELRAQMQMKAK